MTGTVPDTAVVVTAFNAEFVDLETLLVGGGEEPFYTPADGTGPAVIRFRADYLRSALHEVAHWTVAGRQRLMLPDYGYWYSPDDRSAREQAAFFAVEARPQAIESLFCEALGVDFAPSVDNLSLPICEADLSVFRARLAAARDRFQDRGLPPRAQRFLQRLRLLGPSPV